MALPSQVARGVQTGRTLNARARAFPGWLPIASAGAVGLIVIVAGGWMLLQAGRGENAGGPPLESAPATPTPSPTAAATPTTPAPTPAAPLVVNAETNLDKVLASDAQRAASSAPVTDIRQDRLAPATPATAPAQTTPAPAAPIAPVNDAITPTPTPASTTTPTPAPTSAGGGAAGSPVETAIIDAQKRLAANDPLGARTILDAAIRQNAAPGVGTGPAAPLREMMQAINEDLLFGRQIVRGDPLVESYTVKPGDSLVRITQRSGLAVDWRLLQRINRMSSPNRLNVGQTLKLVRGPFHAVVYKGQYRLDLYTGAPDDPKNWMFIRSFTVGLGEGNGTPTGTFVVRRNSKLVNPFWVNPRTGERFAADDPKNPIGEHWLGLDGVGDSSVHVGYGLHGTIEPDSIGQQRSMGCVRMRENDIALVYELLAEQVSVVRIVP